ncbi:MAG: hypothetical protein D6781_05450 [Verrucomicrobia bacterium]|nr:MAG: hypothetical protein D6781_05450 [Verrucomicrobiota bacterium]
MKIRHLTTLAAIAITSVAGAQDFATASASAFADVKKAERELADLRRKIADEKVPLSQELTRLENQIIQKRRDVQAARLRRDNEQFDLNALEKEVQARVDENDYMRNLMADYIRNFETRIHPAEVQLYSEDIHATLNAVDNPNLSAAEKYEKQVAVLRTAIARIEKIIGGDRFDGQGLGEGNVVKDGKIALVGPIAVFAGNDGETVGLAESMVNSLLPIVIDIGPELAPGIIDVATTGEGQLPVDTSLGNAIRLKLTETTVMDEFRQGGPVMYPIFLLAFLTAVIAFFKLFDILSVQSPKAGTLQTVLNHLNQGEDAKALDVATAVKGPFGDLLVAGVKHAREEKELLEEVLYERLLAAQPKLERFLAFIALAAGAAPLLGLLGTVTGMIQTFKLITVFGTGDASKLASGISEALLTTKYGLIIAIPSLLSHALLSRLAKGKLSDLEQMSVAFVNGVSTEEEQG